MKFKYSKQRQRLNYFNAIAFSIFAYVEVYRNGINGFFSILLLALAILSWLNIIYENRTQYLSLHEGVLKANHLFGKSISLSEVETIEKYAGGFTLQSPNKVFKINGSLLHKISAIELEKELQKLNVEWI